MNDLPPTVHSATILAIDDQPVNLALLENILERAGYKHLHVVDDPRKAITTFEDVRPDLVLLDLQMPHVDGFELMAQIHKFLSDETFLPILVLTADTSTDTRRQALAQGATDFLTKPLDTAEVVLRVRNLLETRLLHRRLEAEKDALEDRVAERTRDLRRANEELVVADRMKTDFIAMASHEMRTPLTVIKGFTATMLRRGDTIDAEKRTEHLRTMNRSADRLERLVNSLLLSARIDDSTGANGAIRVRAREFELADFLQRAIADSVLEPSDVTLDCPNTQTVCADAGLLEHIVDNLLSNAAKYGAPPVAITATAGTDPQTIEIAIRDHGQGVPTDFVARMFDRFTQASIGDRRTATGTGLGLWLAQGLARLHGGDLTYEPATPGARFRVHIQQVPAGVDAKANERADRLPTSGLLADQPHPQRTNGTTLRPPDSQHSQDENTKTQEHDADDRRLET